jgi:hypothetical protein
MSHTLPDNYTYQYNLTAQQEITPIFKLRAAYVGSSSHKLIGRDLINQACVDANPAAPTSILSRRPFQGAADIRITKAIDQASYNALQVTAGETCLPWSFAACGSYVFEGSWNCGGWGSGRYRK